MNRFAKMTIPRMGKFLGGCYKGGKGVGGLGESRVVVHGRSDVMSLRVGLSSGKVCK